MAAIAKRARAILERITQPKLPHISSVARTTDRDAFWNAVGPWLQGPDALFFGMVLLFEQHQPTVLRAPEEADYPAPLEGGGTADVNS